MSPRVNGTSGALGVPSRMAPENIGWPDLDTVFASPFVMLTTFRRSGVAVPTVVWAVKVDGRYLFTAPSTTGKVKRLAHTSRITAGPGDQRGRAKPGPVVEARAHPVNDPATLTSIRSALKKVSPVMSRVIELRYRIKRDERLVYEIVHP